MKLKKEIKIDETNIDLATIANNCIYTNTEKVIGIKNSKPVYAQRLTASSIAYTNGATTNLGTINNISEVLYLGGTIKINNNGWSLLPYTSYSSHIIDYQHAQNIYINAWNGVFSIVVQHGTAVSPGSDSYKDANVLVVYTKTTD